MKFPIAQRMSEVSYDIRGEVHRRAKKLEDSGERIIKLNIGNLAPFQFYANQEFLSHVANNIPLAQGYTESQGLLSAREAVVEESKLNGFKNVAPEQVFLGNGVSELISLVTQAVVNPGDEILVPSPDYPLWSAAICLAGGRPVYYKCDYEKNWEPDVGDINNKVTESTRAILIINPNNPTGAVYKPALLKKIVSIAETNNLYIFSDEIYDKILFDDAKHVSIGSLTSKTICFTFNGLSKSYFAAGFRSGWLIVNGLIGEASDLFLALNKLCSMRLCANVPAQLGLKSALHNRNEITRLCNANGRLYEQRNYAVERLSRIAGISVIPPKGAMYLFVLIKPNVFKIDNGENFAEQLLQKQKVLVVPGSGFNFNDRLSFRIVFLPKIEELELAITRIETFLDTLRR